jgi:hypothetical protein
VFIGVLSHYFIGIPNMDYSQSVFVESIVIFGFILPHDE